MRAKQRGVAVLLLALVLMVGFAAFLYARLGKWGDTTTTTRRVNSEVLQQAKTALIGYVAKEVLDLDETAPGRLPCPEAPGDAGTTNEGRAAGNCAGAVGRLPWRTLGIDKLVDASAEPLWVAISPNWFTASGFPPITPTINAGSTGQLSFDGTGDVVAVIFAPGRPLLTNPTASQAAAGCTARNQSRNDRGHVPTGGNPDYRDYLECLNASSPIGSTLGVAIVDNATNEVINDQAVYITAKELLNAIQGPLAERLQRTVAPLLSEYSDKWISGGKFMPYAVPFSPPEANLPVASHCGSGPQSEGLLPIAPNSGACVSTWAATTVAGADVTPVGCSSLPASPTTPVTCSFRYYRFTLAALTLLGITGSASVTATVQGTAPHAGESFRRPLAVSDFSYTAGAGTFSGLTYTPKTNGDIDMSVQATITGSDVCKDGLLPGLVCAVVALLGGATQQTVSVQFPQLGTTVSLAGSKLSAAAKNNNPSLDLLTPLQKGTVLPGPITLSQDDPHYWFFRNNWYRYTYYAVAPGTSAAQTGGNLAIDLFPTTYGSSTDKRFVLALMGPAVTGQTRSATATLNQYVEGDNAATGASPRKFAYQVFKVSGNDRLATCPFTSGTPVCD
jgi:hypothetical protein